MTIINNADTINYNNKSEDRELTEEEFCLGFVMVESIFPSKNNVIHMYKKVNK